MNAKHSRHDYLQETRKKNFKEKNVDSETLTDACTLIATRYQYICAQMSVRLTMNISTQQRYHQVHQAILPIQLCDRKKQLKTKHARVAAAKHIRCVAAESNIMSFSCRFVTFVLRFILQKC